MNKPWLCFLRLARSFGSYVHNTLVVSDWSKLLCVQPSPVYGIRFLKAPLFLPVQYDKESCQMRSLWHANYRYEAPFGYLEL